MSANWQPNNWAPSAPPQDLLYPALQQQQRAGQYPAQPPLGPPPAYSDADYQTGYAAPAQPVPAPVREAEVARPAFNWRRAIFSGSIAYLVLRYSFRVVNPNAASISFVVGLFFGFLGDSRRKNRIFVQELNPFYHLPRTGSYTPAPRRYVPVQPEVIITESIYPVIGTSYSYSPAPRPVRVTTTTSTNTFGVFNPVSYSSASNTSFGGSSSTPPSGPTTSNVRSSVAPGPTPTNSYSSSSAPPPLGRAVRLHQENSTPPTGRR